MINKLMKVAIAVLLIIVGIAMILNGSLDPDKGKYIVGALIAIWMYHAIGRYNVNIAEAQA